MAVKATSISLAVTGVNRMGKVFKEIGAQAADVGKRVATIGFAGAAAAVAQFAAAAKSLGHLSDVAMQAGTTTDDLTRMAEAMNILGIRSQTPEQLALAFTKMGKSIGETGLQGFRRAAMAIARMDSLEERGAAAMAVWGKSGLDFIPLIEAIRQNGPEALDAVLAGMSSVPQSAADAGDAIADAFVITAQGARDLWLAANGKIAESFDDPRRMAMNGVAYLEYFVKAAYRGLETYLTAWAKTDEGIVGGYNAAMLNVGKVTTSTLWSTMKWMGSWLEPAFQRVAEGAVLLWKRLTQGKEAADQYTETLLQLDGGEVKSYGEQMADAASEAWENLAETVQNLKWVPDGTSFQFDDLQRALEDRLEKAGAAAANVSKAAVGAAGTDAAEDVAEKVARAARAARNELLTGGSYRAATMALRADYGKGEEKTVKAVNSLKAVAEKISSASQKTATALDAIQTL